MPRKKSVPSYRFHKARNCAVVTIDGRCIYLGKFGSPESHRQYAEAIANWERTRTAAPVAVARIVYTCGRLAIDYLQFASGYYVKNGRETKQVHLVKQSLRTLCALYEELPADEFGPLKLKNLQCHLIGKGHARSHINKQITCLKLAFKWAAAEERIPASVFHSLQTVGGLKRGRTMARESAPVGPVDDATVNETIKHVSPVVAAMVELQRLTGMRPGEVCSIRPCDVTLSLDGTGCFRPESHKTEHHGRERRIYLGPQALTILRPYLERAPESCCFTPKESVAWHRAKHRANRKTPLYRSHLARYERKRKGKPQRVPADRFTTCAYNRAIQRGCEVAFNMPAELRSVCPKLPESQREELNNAAREWRRRNTWHANQLRHSAATRIRKEFGIETAQVVLGHSSPNTTLIYAERDFEAARAIMAKIG